MLIDWPRADAHELRTGVEHHGVHVLVADRTLVMRGDDELLLEQAELDALDRVPGSDVFRARSGDLRWIVTRRPTSSGRGRGCCG